MKVAVLGFGTVGAGVDLNGDFLCEERHYDALVRAKEKLNTMTSSTFKSLSTGFLATTIIQSSSASVGILQALAATGAVSYGAAIPIIMGQNIGTCITAVLAAIGTNRSAKRTTIIHFIATKTEKQTSPKLPARTMFVLTSAQ